MFPDIVIIEEERRRKRETSWEPVPLRAPSPVPPAGWEDRKRKRPDTSSHKVVIIDISDYSEIP